MAQEVILVSDVPGLGQVGDVRTVKDGYARNYLIPKKLALVSTPNTKRRFELQKEKLEAQRKEHFERAKAQSERVGKVGLVFERSVGQGGRLYGAVTPMDVANELNKQGAAIEKRSILMSGPIKSLGEHTIRVRLHSKIVVDVPVKVVPLESKKTSEHPEHVEAMDVAPEIVPTPAEEA